MSKDAWYSRPEYKKLQTLFEVFFCLLKFYVVANHFLAQPTFN